MIIEDYLAIIIPYMAGAFQAIGVFILAIAGIKAIYLFVKSGFDFGDKDTAVELTKAMSLSLSFKLAAEILKTVTVHSMEEFKVLAAVAFLRVALHFVLYWELKVAHKSEKVKAKVEKNIVDKVVDNLDL